jgi:hypothetical protein
MQNKLPNCKAIHNNLVGKPDGKSSLGRPKRGWEKNIIMDLREIGWEDVDWIYLA